MKVTIDIDCTPEEARRFFGLPDVTALQADILEAMRSRMLANIQSMDAERLLRTWMPSGSEGWEQMMKNFWSQMGSAAKTTKRD